MLAEVIFPLKIKLCMDLPPVCEDWGKTYCSVLSGQLHGINSGTTVLDHTTLLGGTAV